MHPVLGAAGPRHPRVQERLVLEEIQVPPRLVLRVVHRAGTLIAARHRTPETRAPREVQVQIQPALRHVEIRTDHPPPSPNPKAALNRSRVSDIRPIPQHPATERHDPSLPIPRTPGRDTAKPTRSGEEPKRTNCSPNTSHRFAPNTTNWTPTSTPSPRATCPGSRR